MDEVLITRTSGEVVILFYDRVRVFPTPTPLRI